MNASRYILFYGVTALLLSSCTQDQAPIRDKGKVAYKYGSHNEDSYSSDASRSSGGIAEDNEESQPVFKSGYKRSVKAAAVGEVGTTELSDPTGHKFSRMRNDSMQSSDGTSPFSASPSKPLEKKTEVSDLQPPADVAQGGEELTSRKEVAKGGISLVPPVNGGRIIAHFKGISNDGINIEAAEGEPVVAAASGMVAYTGNDVKNYGNMIVLRHDNGWLTAYGNTSKIVVKKNDYVKQGDIIAFVGSTGGVKSPQLHFAVRNGKIPVDPEKYLPNN